MPKQKNPAGRESEPPPDFKLLTVDHLHVRNLEFVDKQGRLRGGACVDDASGTIGLVLCGETKGVDGVLALGVGKSGMPHVSLVDAKGQRRLVVALTDDGSPAIELQDKKGKAVLSVRIDSDRRPLVAYWDANGHARTLAGVDDAGVPHVVVYDEAEEVVGHLGLIDDFEFAWITAAELEPDQAATEPKPTPPPAEPPKDDVTLQPTPPVVLPKLKIEEEEEEPPTLPPAPA